MAYMRSVCDVLSSPLQFISKSHNFSHFFPPPHFLIKHVSMSVSAWREEPRQCERFQYQFHGQQLQHICKFAHVLYVLSSFTQR
jgi:hypothetical protein